MDLSDEVSDILGDIPSGFHGSSLRFGNIYAKYLYL